MKMRTDINPVEEKNCTVVWKNCLQILRVLVGEQSFKTWFEPIRPLRLQNNTLTVQVPSQFFYEWLEEHYVQHLKKAIYAELGANGRLEYSIVIDKGSEKQQPYTINIANIKKLPPPIKKDDVAYLNPYDLKDLKPYQGHSMLNRQFSFDNFVEGDCNRVAYGAAQSIARNPNNAFNPLMIYSKVGLGKTHLAQAIGNEAQEMFPKNNIMYVSSDVFIAQFVDALRQQNVQSFTNHYIKADMLIVDDIQFFAGKEKSQESFFHVFNHLHQAGRQIVMTCDCPPYQLKGLQERLLSRFKWGFTTEIETPNYETRLAIVQTKAKQAGAKMPQNVAEYVAKQVDTNNRELHGVVMSMIGHATLLRSDINMDVARRVIKKVIDEAPDKMILTPDTILKTVAEHFGLQPDDLKSKSRRKESVEARQIAMYLCSQHTQASLKTIGLHFGGKDHSTIAHASSAAAEKIKNDMLYKSIVDALKAKLNLRRT